ncbi:MAG: class I adenylate-forming enzyme family protein [Pseudomonadales bacterium]
MEATNAARSVAELTGSGGPYELGVARSGNASFNVFVNAPRNLATLYRDASATGSDFYVYEDERYSFADAWQRAEQVAASLSAMGVEKGDRVGIAMRNYPEWILAFMGVTRLGAVVVAMNAWWSGEEMIYAIDDSGLTTLFVDRERLEHLGPYLDERDLDVIAVRTDHTSGRGVMNWASFMRVANATPPEVDVQPEDPATILYTSGSTAHPKGVVSSHRAIIHGVVGLEAAAALRRAGSGRAPRAQPHPQAMILTVPLFHVTGLNVQMLSCFRGGRKLVGMYKWDAEKALAIIEAERITQFNGVPTMAWEMVNSPNFDKYDTSSLKSMGGGGAAMAPEHTRQISRRTKGSVSPGAGYGMTETNGLATGISGRELLERPTSCGRPVPPLVEIQIVGPDGSGLEPGRTGEIWIRGPMNFSGYWNRPEDTAATLTDGWVHTGDVGHLDAEGFLYITDRAKDLVIRGGENIGCQEVEAVIYEHPDVAECAVFGVPDTRLGETVAAVVMPRPGRRLTAGDVRSHVGEHMARFKVPEHVWIQNESLPRTASGKIFKRSLKDQAAERLKTISS